MKYSINIVPQGEFFKMVSGKFLISENSEPLWLNDIDSLNNL